MKKISLVVLLAILWGAISAQSIWSNEITGINPNTQNPYRTGQIFDPYLVDDDPQTGIGRGGGIVGNNTNDRYNASGWSISTSLNESDNDYYYFTLTPKSGYKINLTSFEFTAARNANGPKSISLRSSVDNYANDIGNITYNTTLIANPTTYNISLTGFQNITTSITFRIYGWNGVAESGTFGINSFNFNGATALPVTFSNLQAAHSNGQLKIKWTTLTETNNNHFEVEVSDDGSNFTKIATISSKAINGNSGIPIQYEHTIPLSNLALGLFPLIFAMLSFGFKKRSYQMALLGVSIAIGIFLVSCNKESISINESNNKIFIRIAQVDIDGTKTTSKIIKAINQ